ncbi:MAG TPA: hypothetical protein VLB83_02980 [Candidatus Paceibacterota bacterium]|nr:hypothetical protein [Candidatus Paceibacterota bacterium]
MDIDAILLEVRRALLEMEQTGQAGGLVFYNTPNTDASALRAELHLRNGALEEFLLYDPNSPSQTRKVRDLDGEDTVLMIATLRAGAPPR